jgi:hypothetical protein
MSASSTVLNLATALDFANGQGVLINEAGPNNASGLGVPVPSASGPGGGNATYQYQVCALTANGGQTAASSAAMATVTNQPASLSWVTNQFITLTWSAVAGADGYAVYGRTSGNMQLLGMSNRDPQTGGTFTFFDVGQAPVTRPTCLAPTPPAIARRDYLRTTISSGGGTTSLILAAASSAAVTGVPVNHDDSDAFDAAIAALASQQGILYIPRGSYLIARFVLVNAQNNLRIMGDGPGRTTVIDNSVGPMDSSAGFFRYGLFSIVDTSDFELASLTLKGQRGHPTDIWKKGVFIRGTQGAPNQPRSVVVHDVVAVDFSGEAIYADGTGVGIVFRDNYCKDCRSNALNINGDTTSDLHGAIVDNVVEGGFGFSALQGGGASLTVARNRVRVPGRTGGDVVLVQGVKALELVGNTIADCLMDSAGVSPLHVGFNDGDFNISGVVADNVIVNNTLLNRAPAVLIENAIGPLLVTGNLIANNGGGVDTFSPGISVDGDTTGSVVIEGNHFGAGANQHQSGIEVTQEAASSPAFDVRIGENHFTKDLLGQYGLARWPTNQAVISAVFSGARQVGRGDYPRTTSTLELSYGVWTAAATSQTITLGALPKQTRICSVVARTVAYAGVSGAQLRFGITSGGTELLLAHAVTSNVTKGLAAVDLGSLLAAPVQGGVLTSGMWTNGTSLYVRMTASANLGTGASSNFTSGSTTFYIITESMP